MRPDTVDIHVLDLDLPPGEASACRALLDDSELARAQRFRTELLRSRWIVCRARLRQVLAGYLGIAPEAIRFDEVGHGKPVIAGAPRAVHFNLSHSHGLAAVAVTDIGPVGIDIELERIVADWRAVSERYFSLIERRQLAELDAKDRPAAFMRCWTRKEAVIKALGEGLSARLDAFDVSLDDGEGGRPVTSHDGADAVQDWRVHHLRPRPGFVGALAVRWPDPVLLRIRDQSLPAPDNRRRG